VTYWVSGADGFDVITTIDTRAGEGGDRGGIVRVSSRLLPGQSQVISVPAAIGQPQPTLRIRRVADRVEVENATPLSD